MNKILLLSDELTNDPTIADLEQLSDYSIYRAKDTQTALKIIKRHSPDFVMCAGKIGQAEDGTFFLDLN